MGYQGVYEFGHFYHAGRAHEFDHPVYELQVVCDVSSKYLGLLQTGLIRTGNILDCLLVVHKVHLLLVIVDHAGRTAKEISCIVIVDVLLSRRRRWNLAKFEVVVGRLLGSQDHLDLVLRDVAVSGDLSQWGQGRLVYHFNTGESLGPANHFLN